MIYHLQVFKKTDGETEVRNCFSLNMKNLAESYVRVVKTPDTAVFSQLENGKERLLKGKELVDIKQLIKDLKFQQKKKEEQT